ncbi:hypothetical protein HHI36_018805 [Cryptolaemus montrouzieri]|uniref:Uncharacterized protein n=1 Tax=Cryptolaemus montrouzieri TaxID=559131 RepID=A0ABD2P1W2_9CUCU
MKNYTERVYGVASVDMEKKQTLWRSQEVKSNQEQWADFGEKMKEKCSEDQKLFFNMVKSLKREKLQLSSEVKDEDCDLLNTMKVICSRWTKHFTELLNGEECRR